MTAEPQRSGRNAAVLPRHERRDRAGAAAVAGLDHRALLCDDLDDLGASVAPLVDTALGEGLPVTIYADAVSTRVLSSALGPAARHVTLASGPDAAPVRIAVPKARDAPVDPAAVALGPAAALRHGRGAEDRINVMLADQQMTLTCALAHGPESDPVHRHLVECHPHLLEGDTARPNPAFTRPRRLSLLPAIGWDGRSLRRVPFRRDDELHVLRAAVASSLEDVAAAADDADAAVLAVHEAALAALTASTGSREPCLLDVWTTGRALVLDVSAPPGVRPRWERQVGLLHRIAASTGVRLDAGERLVRVVVTCSDTAPR